MKFSAVLAIVIVCANFAASEPTLIAATLAKKYLFHKFIGGKSLPVIQLPKLPLPSLPSLTLPYPFSALWPVPAPKPAPVHPGPTVVYYALPTEEYANIHPIPEGEKDVPNHQIGSDASAQAHASDSGSIDLRNGPIYVAETPAVRHVAPLPEGYTSSVLSQNLQPLPPL
ncbi:uncharacterized protein LOC131681543 [Topomyia yanbarensis]|uniref:uncharacterized protein LOC131681543 n=1 Tax=Topomyia yanbarensis TaxID=2498891 RepID=UPI00273A8E88|nr:uncharacterized protein LOC131681543 [Topomyia yanbarensis]